MADKHTAPATRPRAVRELLVYLKPYRWQLVAAFIALSASSALFFMIGYGLSKLTNLISASGGADLKNLDRFMLVAYAVLCGYALGLFIRNYLMRAIGERVGVALRQEVFDQLVQRSPGFFDRNGHAELQTRITGDAQALQSVIGTAVPNGLHYGLLLVAGAAFAILTSVKLSLIVLACIPLIFLPGALLSGRVDHLAAERQSAQAAGGAHVAEMLRNVKTVQAYQHGRQASGRYARLLEKLLGATWRSIRLEAWLTTLTSFMAYAALSVVIWVGAREIVSGALTLGNLVGFVFYANLATTAAAQLVSVYVTLRNATGAVSRLLDLRDETETPIGELGGVCPKPALIELDDLHFRYPSRPDQAVLEGCHLHVNEGEMLALVGPSGSGKSTILDLLQMFYAPQRGEIRVGGVPFANLDPEQWRKRLALVPQMPELFSGTVLDNLRLGAPDADERMVRAALATAQILDLVESMPQGLLTDLGQDGLRLSGGQRQRLALARALLRDPALLLLDEPTSALDPESESAVQRALDASRPGRTTIVVTHRMETAMRADRIAMLHRGRVVAAGTHAQLMVACPSYAGLVQLEMSQGPGPGAITAGEAPQALASAAEYTAPALL
ncbi:hypothetical protein ASG87_16825 [Frateuria sp. Soil773]|nr:hypothetical protein ASG87_16825 [Frateuria sp. Soil773]